MGEEAAVVSVDIYLLLCVSGISDCNFCPEGGPGMSEITPLSRISELSFDSAFLSPLSFLP